MKTIIRLIAVILVTIALIGIGVAAAPKRPTGFLDNLHSGQKISLAEKIGGRFEIGIFKNNEIVPMVYTITDVEPDYIIVKDIVGAGTMTIPIYSISAIKTMNFPAN